MEPTRCPLIRPDERTARGNPWKRPNPGDDHLFWEGKDATGGGGPVPTAEASDGAIRASNPATGLPKPTREGPTWSRGAPPPEHLRARILKR